jgi:putative addiction module killer protein
MLDCWVSMTLGQERELRRALIDLPRNPGDLKPIGFGVSELRIDYGPGYRVYYKRTDTTVYLLLCGGAKGTQAADIKFAIAMAADLKR